MLNFYPVPSIYFVLCGFLFCAHLICYYIIMLISYTFSFCNLFSKTYQDSPNDESAVLKAVQNVRAMIDKEVAAGTNPNNIFVCGFSQGGLLFSLCPSLHLKTHLSLCSFSLVNCNEFCRCLDLGKHFTVPNNFRRRCHI